MRGYVKRVWVHLLLIALTGSTNAQAERNAAVMQRTLLKLIN
jgi:hypothetical protein